jgi:ABC-type transporter lipoprotein component MlaA
LFGGNVALADKNDVDFFDDDSAEEVYVPRSKKTTNDPLRFINKPLFRVFIVLDRFAIRPLSIVYSKMPLVARSASESFSGNVSDVFNALNAAIAHNEYLTSRSLSRVLINCTLGLCVRDFASDFGIEQTNVKLSDVLSFYHVPNGPYLFLPSGPGYALDSLNFMQSNLFPFAPPSVRITRTSLIILSVRSNNLSAIDDGLYNSPDPYIATRTFFTATARRPNLALRDGG